MSLIIESPSLCVPYRRHSARVTLFWDGDRRDGVDVKHRFCRTKRIRSDKDSNTFGNRIVGK